MRQSAFFNNVQSLRPAILLEKRLWNKYFPETFFVEHPGWLLLTAESR